MLAKRTSEIELVSRQTAEAAASAEQQVQAQMEQLSDVRARLFVLWCLSIVAQAREAWMTEVEERTAAIEAQESAIKAQAAQLAAQLDDIASERESLSKESKRLTEESQMLEKVCLVKVAGCADQVDRGTASFISVRKR